MDLYKIKYDISTPDIDQLTINKDSRFAIQLDLVKHKYYDIQLVDYVTDTYFPVLIVKKTDGTEEYYYTEYSVDDYYNNPSYKYIWKLDKFDQDISCYIYLYTYYYNEETGAESEQEGQTIVCRVACKDSSVANDAVTSNPYETATTIKIGKMSQAGDDSIAIGKESIAPDNAIAIGNNAFSTATDAIAVGNSAEVSTGANNSIAIGQNAKINKDLDNKIQLGAGTLSAGNVLMQVKEFPLLNIGGKIIRDRLDLDGIGTEENPITSLIFRDENNSGTLWGVSILDGQLVVGEI